MYYTFKKKLNKIKYIFFFYIPIDSCHYRNIIIIVLSRVLNNIIPNIQSINYICITN